VAFIRLLSSLIFTKRFGWTAHPTGVGPQELDPYVKELDSSDPRVASYFQPRLRNWQVDADFVAVREPSELDMLPASQQKEW
jgi:hypothetical protein